MNNKTKKWLTVTGCLVACAVLVGLIGSQLKDEPLTDEPLTSQSSQPSDVTVTPPEKEKEVVTAPPEIPKEQPSTEQTIQGDVSKPEYTNEQLKDDTKTPDGKPVTAPPPVVDHDKVEKPKEPPKPDIPQGGDTSNGKIYVPGFGWIENEGGGGEGVVGKSDGDINKPVGIMGE